MLKIDSHHHFWKYDAVEYGWIGESMRTLRRDFLPAHLHRALDEGGIEQAISVQARQTLQETDWLLELAAKDSRIAAVVGWVPLASAQLDPALQALASQPKLKAVRHVLQDEPANQLMDHADFNRGIARLHHYGLRYDLLIFERHLSQAIAFVDRHPNQIFILDHVAKPNIAKHVMEPWRTKIGELAKRQNVYCKISGMVTESEWANWKTTDLTPYLDTVLQAFGPARLMYGSDWPVMLVASSYGRWSKLIGAYLSRLSEAEQTRIWGATAKEAYQIP
ncbi:MAG: amidohydrolase family protein [Acidobacteriia bacterium]|nr:amidohydrolase family protein [Terriglobia bacterium]